MTPDPKHHQRATYGCLRPEDQSGAIRDAWRERNAPDAGFFDHENDCWVGGAS